MNGSQYIWILSGIYLFLTAGALAGDLLQNVALNKKAVQSSGASGDADKAVDGIKDVRFAKGSCTLTNSEPNPWWRVDLQSVYKITAVTITNRGNDEKRLDGAEIWIGSSNETNDSKNIRCAVISHIPAGRTVYFPCSFSEVRYVTVLLPGIEKILTLCEVEVFSVDYVYPLPNVALKGDATQSSTLSFAAASKAIDGRRNTLYSHGSCSHTAESETDPWWRVDLQRTHIVTYVKITNRGDCCDERLDGAEIRIGNSLGDNGNSNPRCASISHIRAGITKTFHCDGGSMDGRFVNVILPGEKKTLTLCEVEVYGTPTVEPLLNVALNKPTKQSSTFNGGDDGKASNAVNGCKSATFSGSCCSHTVPQRNPWWEVDLLAMHKVSAVTIINRRGKMSSRLQGAEVWIWNTKLSYNNMRCGTIPQVVDSRAYTFHCGGMEGRHIRVTNPGDQRILTLCEVQVFATLAEPPVITPSPPPPPPPPTPPPPPSVSKLLGGRKVTVVGERLCWSDALFFCRRHHWDLLSLRSPEEQSEVEKLLSAAPFPLSGHVWLGLRRYIMSGRWFWMSGESMRFTYWVHDTVPHLYSSPCGGMAAGDLHLWGDQPCEQPLNFICQSGAEAGAQRVDFYSTKQSHKP